MKTKKPRNRYRKTTDAAKADIERKSNIYPGYRRAVDHILEALHYAGSKAQKADHTYTTAL